VPDVPQRVIDHIYAAIYGVSPHVAAGAAEKGFSIGDAIRVARRGTPSE